MNELLQNVHSIFKNDGFLKLHSKDYYNIPLYQRGYKWTAKQVGKLLDDIDRFSPIAGKFYCVQNITLVPTSNGCFNVVDGQQRLTTMVLILSCLGETNLVANKVRFPDNSIREKTNKFLNNYITASDKLLLDEFPSWEDLIDEKPEFDHQDIYHLYQAYNTISLWLDELDNKDEFLNKLLEHVMFICNYIEGENEERIFGNLNSKRIYLDGADLVRATLITRVTLEESKRESDIKNIVRVNERRVRIGWRLDEINAWWGDNNVKTYFEPWIRIQPSGDISFSFLKFPINRLFALFIESEGKDNLSLEAIEEYESSLEVYKKINKLNDTLKDWYEDKTLYHFLGFLFAQKRDRKEFNFKTIWDYWQNECKTRDDFKSYLLKLIKLEVFGDKPINEVFGDGKNWYDGDNKTLVQILLLLDIIEANKEYRDKLKSNAFFKKGNDIEHIFPRNPQNPKDKVSYVSFLKKYDENLKNEEILKSFKEKYEDAEYLREVDSFIEKYTDSIPIHSIGNLVLLYESLNRSISNNPYSYKRKKVLEFFNQGNFIQPHTLNVFARYFINENSTGRDLEHWTKDDITSNEEAIKNTLLNYLNKELKDG